MPLTIQAKTERDEILVQYFDRQDRLRSCVDGIYHDDRSRYEAFVILRYIDPYGFTILNQLQLRTFVEELDTLAAIYEGNVEELIVFRIVKGMALYCQERVHTYLWFVGD